MNIRKVSALLLSLLFVLGGATSFASAANAAELEPAGTIMVEAADPPLPIETLLRVAALQPDSLRSTRAKLGLKQVRGTTLGDWSYTIRYRQVRTGWQLAGYGFELAAAEEMAAGGSRTPVGGSRQVPLFYNSTIIPVPDLPPGPGTIPVPNEPSNPGQPVTQPGGSCPLGSSGYDVVWVWEWTPTHIEIDDLGNEVVVLGNWNMVSYGADTSPSDLCD